MTQYDQMQRLERVAGLMFEGRLADLKATARAMQQTKDHLTDLIAKPVNFDNLAPVALAAAGLRYERWADGKRAELNLTLARQTADWLDARDAARVAFGKTQALDAVKEKMRAATARRLP